MRTSIILALSACLSLITACSSGRDVAAELSTDSVHISWHYSMKFCPSAAEIGVTAASMVVRTDIPASLLSTFDMPIVEASRAINERSLSLFNDGAEVEIIRLDVTPEMTSNGPTYLFNFVARVGEEERIWSLQTEALSSNPVRNSISLSRVSPEASGWLAMGAFVERPERSEASDTFLARDAGYLDDAECEDLPGR